MLKRVSAISLALVLLLSSTAHAASWQKFRGTPFDTTWSYLDSSSIEKTDNGTYLAWVKEVLNPENASLREEERASFLNIWSDDEDTSEHIRYLAHYIHLIEFDLRTRRFRRVSVAYYKSNGETISAMNHSNADAEWLHAIPESRGETMFNFVKAYLKRKK